MRYRKYETDDENFCITECEFKGSFGAEIIFIGSLRCAECQHHMGFMSLKNEVKCTYYGVH